MSPSAISNEMSSSRSVVNHTSLAPLLSPGLYVPTVAFFRPDDSVDVETTTFHATRLAKTGIAGLVTHGSNGEAVHLDHNERQLINRATRTALDAAGKRNLPVIVGCGAQSTRETIQLCREASTSGGNYALILPPAYYGGLLSVEHIIQYFNAVADESPIPILIYNFPGACSGLDLSSDTIITLSKHPNIVGVKLTCGNTGKLARVVAATEGSKRNRGSNLSFRTFGGSVDFTLQTLVVGGHGIIGGTANVAPLACVKLIELWEQGKLVEAKELQAAIARADWVAIQGGFVSVKAVLQEYYDYGGAPRKPCALVEGDKLTQQVDGFAELVAIERKLEK